MGDDYRTVVRFCDPRLGNNVNKCPLFGTNTEFIPFFQLANFTENRVAMARQNRVVRLARQYASA